MRTGSNPTRVAKLRLERFKAVCRDMVDAIDGMSVDTFAQFGAELAKLAPLFRAEGAMQMAGLLEPDDDFDDELQAALQPFFDLAHAEAGDYVS